MRMFDARAVVPVGAGLVARCRLAAFDGRAFYAYTEQRLPSYAAPVFVRLASSADITSTFKLRKFELQRDGYDPQRIRDPLFVRDPSARDYVPVNAKNLARLSLRPFAGDAV